MDRASFETIKQQNNKINWILGPIEVEAEFQRSKNKHVYSSSEAFQATVNGSNVSAKPFFFPSSSEVMVSTQGYQGPSARRVRTKWEKLDQTKNG